MARTRSSAWPWRPEAIGTDPVIHAFDPACLGAFERLLAEPDPPEMPRRTHVYQCAGDPHRRETRLPVILMGWLQRRHLDVDVEEPLGPARHAMVLQSARHAGSAARLLAFTVMGHRASGTARDSQFSE